MSNVHFIAIGGAVMHNLALELNHQGLHVTGSDDEIFDPAKSRLEKEGLLPPLFGWFPDKITDRLDAVILGMHAKLDNPELLKAQELNLPIYSFPEYIAIQSKNKTRVVIAGSHGKTTCTAMLMHVLKENNLEFDYLVGSQIDGYQRMVKISDSPIMIIEGDEYLSSPVDRRSKFLHYQPHVAMITGIAWDHVNVFPTYDSYLDTFSRFIDSTIKGFYYSIDGDLKSLAHEKDNWDTYQAVEFDSLGNGSTSIRLKGESVVLPFFGKHNIENASGVVKIARELGVDEDAAWRALSTFPGTSKRLEKLYEKDGITVFRDFAHAPSKVKATVQAVRNEFKEAQLMCVFEVHTFSSLQLDFMNGYKGYIDSAEQALVLYDPHVYEMKGIEVPTHKQVKEAFGDVAVFSDPKALEEVVHKQFVEANAGHKPLVLLWMSSGPLGGIHLTP